MHTRIDRVRIARLIRQSINKFQLDLSDLVVLTEAASGNWALTPFIAAKAGARNVYALGQDSSHASLAELQTLFDELTLCFFDIAKPAIIDEREHYSIKQADIITNLGFVRPIDKKFVSQFKENAVVPLMWETWEHRPGELDLDACRENNIAVLGTNEAHQDLRLFDSIGLLPVKLLLSKGIEIVFSSVAVIGQGPFMQATVKVLKNLGAEVLTFTPGKNGYELDNLYPKINEVDAVVLMDMNGTFPMLGYNENELIDRVIRLNPSLIVAHVCGSADRKKLTDAGIRCVPDNFAKPKRMSVTAEYLGPKPLIDLHCAGLKVGEIMARTRRKISNSYELECEVLKNLHLAQGFEGYHPIELLNIHNASDNQG